MESGDRDNESRPPLIVIAEHKNGRHPASPGVLESAETVTDRTVLMVDGRRNGRKVLH